MAEGKVVNKEEFVKELMQETGLKKEKAKQVVNAFLGLIKSHLEKGEAVKFTGFGTFLMQKTSPRKARNPKTGKEIDVPAKLVPKFKAGAELKAISKTIE